VRSIEGWRKDEEEEEEEEERDIRWSIEVGKSKAGRAKPARVQPSRWENKPEKRGSQGPTCRSLLHTAYLLTHPQLASRETLPWRYSLSRLIHFFVTASNHVRSISLCFRDQCPCWSSQGPSVSCLVCETVMKLEKIAHIV